MAAVEAKLDGLPTGCLQATTLVPRRPLCSYTGTERVRYGTRTDCVRTLPKKTRTDAYGAPPPNPHPPYGLRVPFMGGDYSHPPTQLKRVLLACKLGARLESSNWWGLWGDVTLELRAYTPAQLRCKRVSGQMCACRDLACPGDVASFHPRTLDDAPSAASAEQAGGQWV